MKSLFRPLEWFAILAAVAPALAQDPTPAPAPKLPGLVVALPPGKDESHLYSVAFTPDGKSLVTVLGKNMHFRDTATWEEQRVLTMKDEERRNDFTTDGARFSWLEGSLGRSPAGIYDSLTGEPVLELELRPKYGTLQALTFAAGGSKLIGAGSYEGAANFWRWDTATGAFEVTTLPEIRDIIYAMAVSADGKTAAVSFTRETLEVAIVEVETGKILHRLKIGDHVAKNLALSPDAGLLAVCGQDEPIRLFDLAAGKMIAKLDHTYAAGLRFSPDGTLLASSDREEFCLWSLATRKLVGVFGRLGVRAEVHNSQINANGPEAGVAFSPDGKWVAWGCETEEWGTVRVFEVAALLAAAAPK